MNCYSNKTNVSNIFGSKCHRLNSNHTALAPYRTSRFRRALAIALLVWLPQTLLADTLLPAEIQKDQWLLAFVDVETTGLRPGFHEMIDIGMIITELDGTPVDRLFLRIMPEHPERTEPGAAAVNGFSVELWQERGFISERQAVAKLIEFTARVSEQRSLLMVGFNAWFDISFIDHLFRGEGQSWRQLFHYFVLDLPSMAWGQGLRDLSGNRLAERLGIQAETDNPLEHTGLTGARYNLSLYQALVKSNPELQKNPARLSRP